MLPEKPAASAVGVVTRRERISAMAEEYRLLTLTGADTQGHMPDPWGACSGCPSGTDWDTCPAIAQAKGIAPPS